MAGVIRKKPMICKCTLKGHECGNIVNPGEKTYPTSFHRLGPVSHICEECYLIKKRRFDPTYKGGNHG